MCRREDSRDLKTFAVSLDRAVELAASLPESAVRVAESGIHTAADMRRLRAAGYEAFLIGESLMRKADPGSALRQLLVEAAGEPCGSRFVRLRMLEDALLAVEAGADAVGFVFAPSKRQVTSEQVEEITKRLPAGVEKVGVFATDNPFEVEHVVASSGLTAAQLHGAFDAG